jgi:hypothetical protein
MIIEAPYTVGDVVSVKLSTGEELISRFTEKTPTHIKLTKPMILVATEQGVGFAPFMFTISPETKIEISINNIICVVKSAKDAADLYIKQTTGLAL